MNFISIVLIVLILIFLIIFKRKYIFNAFNKNNLYVTNDLNNKNKKITSSAKYTHYYKNNSYKDSEFSKRNLREEMFKLYKGTPEDKLKALKIAEELADKSTLPILRRSLKDANSEIVRFAALLIRNFK